MNVNQLGPYFSQDPSSLQNSGIYKASDSPTTTSSSVPSSIAPSPRTIPPSPLTISKAVDGKVDAIVQSILRDPSKERDPNRKVKFNKETHGKRIHSIDNYLELKPKQGEEFWTDRTDPKANLLGELYWSGPELHSSTCKLKEEIALLMDAYEMTHSQAMQELELKGPCEQPVNPTADFSDVYPGTAELTVTKRRPGISECRRKIARFQHRFDS